MSKMHRLQRGAADIVAVAVGMTILSIAAIGTSMSLVYGREALVQQEHYKVAAYQLRGVMEEELAHIQMNVGPTDQQGYFSSGRYLNFQPIDLILDSPQDRGGAVYQTIGEITRESIEILPADKPMWGVMTLRATWRETVVSGIPDGRSFDLEGPDQSITMTAPFLFRIAL